MTSFDPEKFRQEFPIITRTIIGDINERQPLVYFDNAATTQKPHCVINCYQQYYSEYNANVHRGSHALGVKATTAFEQSRDTVQKFINAKSSKEIIWTKGTTESINLVAQSLGSHLLSTGDEIVLSESEHHANIVPWQMVAEKTGAIIKVLALDEQGRIDTNKLEDIISSRTKIVCCAHISNVIGKVNPIEKIISRAKKVSAISIIDGAQAIGHMPVDVQALNCDFYAFSAHKMYGPTGVGVLYGKKSLLEGMSPYQSGGEMIKTVSFNQPTIFNELPFKFEAGTPNIAGIIAFAEAILFIQQNSYTQIQHFEKNLVHYCYQALSNISAINFVVKMVPDIPVLSFTVSTHHNHDIASALNSYNIAIRSGHHCAMPLMEYLNINGCLRVSLSAYNTFEEIDYFIDSLKQIIANQTADDQVLHLSIDEAKQTKYGNLTPSKPLISDLIAKFSKVKGWDSRHREIMLLGKELNCLDKAQRNEQSLIVGCESLAWLVASKDEFNVYHFQADSDAKIIRGLLVIVLTAFNEKTAQQIQIFNIKEYFKSLGLIEHLSPSRGNGLIAIVEKIRNLVKV